MSSGGFDLPAAIREAVRNSTSPDPYVIAQEVAANIPVKARQEVIAYLLPDAVRRCYHVARNATTTAGVPVDSDGRWKGVSAESHAGKLPYFTGSGWKFRRELTHNDCIFIAEQYQMMASANEAFAKQFLLLADALLHAGVETLGELPTSVFESCEFAA